MRREKRREGEGEKTNVMWRISQVDTLCDVEDKRTGNPEDEKEKNGEKVAIN
jgi:hypothetical protein